MTQQRKFRADDEAVSPVIGVILMVAITVILAAIIGTFVLNLGGSVSTNVQAGVSIQHDSGENKVTVTWTSNQNANSIDLRFSESGVGSDSTATLSSVGSRDTYTCTNDGAEVDVTATGISGDSETVLTTKSIDEC